MSLTNTSGESRTGDATNEDVEYLLVGGEWQKPHSSALIQRNYLQAKDDRQSMIALHLTAAPICSRTQGRRRKRRTTPLRPAPRAR